MRKMLLCRALLPFLWLAPCASAQLKAGAARIDITPAMADLPQPFTSVDSKLYIRTLVLENNGTRVVLVSGDLPTIATDVFADLNQRIAQAANTKVENVMLSVTHTHNAVRLDNNPVGIILPGSAKVTKITGEQIIDSVKQAVSALQPARAGYSSGEFHLAGNNGNQPGAGNGPNTGTGPGGGPVRPGNVAGAAGGNRAASSSPAIDRAIGVFKVESTSGEPIALLVNNGPEPVMSMGMKTEVSADVAGVMERYVEQRFGDKTVVLYTVGSPPGTVINGRQRVAGTTPADPKVLMNAVGVILGEEVLGIASRVKATSDLALSGAVKVLSCPGKATSPLNNPGSCSDAPDSKLPKCVFTDKDTGPVDLRVGVIHLGDVALVDSDSNVQPPIWAKVRNESPNPANTMLVALIYGPMHYVVQDSEYPTNSYQVTASMAKAGCAEKGFESEALKMLEASPTKAK